MQDKQKTSPFSLLAPVANRLGSRLLQTDPVTLERLAALEGKVISLEFEGTDFHLYMFPTATGILLQDSWDGEVDVHMQGKPSELLKMGMAGKTSVTPGKINVRFQGDLHVGQAFKKILDDMKIDWEELLSQYVGDIAAYHASRLMRGARAHVREAIINTARNGSEYARFEAGLLPADWRVEEFINDVDKLRDDVDRLSIRIDRLLKPGRSS